MLDSEMSHLRQSLGREPTETETAIISAEWSEHCSYKSSREHLRMLPRDAPYVISDKGLDSGVIDVGGGYVVTAHIESHNHPSAVEPYGGAATGVGGIIRDIMSAGTRPICILDGLRFGDIEADRHAAWLLRGAVRGISDYGNCLGIPTIGGETGFDPSYSKYTLVDVAAVGFGIRERLIHNMAEPGDHVVLLGGPTGYDGVGGAQFASERMDEDDRSAVQIPDPFMEKMVMESILELRPHLKALKDLGGGGLACATSETADTLGVGITIDTDAVHTRDTNMTPPQIMSSESQERMLAIVDDIGLAHIREVCGRFRVPHSIIGRVNDTGMLTVRHHGTVVAELPASLAAHAPPLRWPSKPSTPSEDHTTIPDMGDYTHTLEEILGGADCASRNWIYSQYDHEVGIRTVSRPGQDASVLRLDNGKYLAVSMCGSPRHCHLNPYHGTMGCFEEACRNVRCAGATPIAMLDHLQFGSPEDPEIFWSFLQSVRALADYSKHTGIPCIGGKVSLYNETDTGPIKPSPVILVLGLADQNFRRCPIRDGDALYIIGMTKNETGGSSYHYHTGMGGGTCPRVDMVSSTSNGVAASSLAGLGTIHDCSRGGLAVAASRMCITSNMGCTIDLDTIPGDVPHPGVALFAESHSRYLASIPSNHIKETTHILGEAGVPHARIGTYGGTSIRFEAGGTPVCDVMVDKAHNTWSESLERMIHHG